ncbi:MAG: hypothetical protein J4F32_02250 [Dehalococcoidia bacterium]|nr:hypothetical protein [Dehalococcoidia bacterium]
MRPDDASALRRLTEQLLRTNLRVGVDGRTGRGYRYLCPSPHEYRHQWFWDSCFHAVAAAHVDAEHAVAELETLLARQREDGFIGHMHFWERRRLDAGDLWSMLQSKPALRPRSSGLIQPPVLAQAVERVAEIAGDSSLPARFLARLDRYHAWLAEQRADGDGLLAVVSPYEAGTDHSPAFDAMLGVTAHHPSPYRLQARLRLLDLRLAVRGYDNARMLRTGPFYAKDPLVNALYADALETMARMHRAQANNAAAEGYEARATQTAEAMLRKMYSPERGAFFLLEGRGEERVDCLTVAGLMPLTVQRLPADVAGEVIERCLTDAERFRLHYPLPSVAACDPAFDSRGQALSWRGPAWVNTNWLVWRGLRRHGFDDLAEQLTARTVEMVAGAGLREFYNPLTGEGLGAKSFGWSALALDMAEGTR